jgi:hypothetical protein
MRSRLVVLAVVMLCLPLFSLPARGAPAPVHLALIHNVPMVASSLHIAELVHSGDDEYVTIHNAGTTAISLEGYRLQSVEGDQWYTLSGQPLRPDAIIRIHSGPAAMANPPQDVVWTTRYIWNDAGDRARLYDPQGTLIAGLGY